MKLLFCAALALVYVNYANSFGIFFDWSTHFNSGSAESDELQRYKENAWKHPGQFPGIFVHGEGSTMSSSSSVNDNGVGYKIKLEQRIKNGVLYSTETIYDVNGKMQHKTTYTLQMNDSDAEPQLVEQITG